MSRSAEIERQTRETDIKLRVELDGEGYGDVDTTVGFLDHMLQLFARHSLCDLKVYCRGDVEVDAHHTTEDVGIVLGQAVAKALGSRKGVRRYGFASVPLDEALAQVTIDLSGRPFMVFNGELPGARVGEFDSELVIDFFQAFATHAKATLHMDLVRARNTHHALECLFKAAARAVRQAIEVDARETGVPSTKEHLD